MSSTAATATATSPHGDGKTKIARNESDQNEHGFESTRRGSRHLETGVRLKPDPAPAVDVELRLGGSRLLAPGARRCERRSRGLEVDELEVDHVGRVALTRAELDDARVTARPVGEARSDLREQPMDDVVGAKRGERLPAGMEVAALPQA